MKKMLSVFASGVSLTALSLTLTGCGGGMASSPSAATPSTGRATITLQWPARTTASSRLLPEATNSARVTFSLNGTPVYTTLLVRPSEPGSVAPSTTTAIDLPSGSLTVDAVAYPNIDGTGTPLAQATALVSITPGSSTPVRLTLGTTITRVDILPQNISLTAVPTTLTAVAYDAQNNIVLSDSWNWTNTNPAVVVLTANGPSAIVRALGTGNAVVTATETESGKSAQKTFDVVFGG